MGPGALGRASGSSGDSTGAGRASDSSQRDRQIFRTKKDEFVKKGQPKGSREINLLANYFPVKTNKEDWIVRQYRYVVFKYLKYLAARGKRPVIMGIGCGSVIASDTSDWKNKSSPLQILSTTKFIKDKNKEKETDNGPI